MTIKLENHTLYQLISHSTFLKDNLSTLEQLQETLLKISTELEQSNGDMLMKLKDMNSNLIGILEEDKH